jgi:hypothetical protein
MSMHRVFAAALELQAALESLGRPFCFIGGLALQRWGEIRMTQDADATVLTEIQHDEEVIRQLLAQFKSRVSNGAEFARHARVLLLEAAYGIGLDVALGARDFECHAVLRATPWDLPGGDLLRTCSAEDLIVHKAFAAREKDWLDIDGIFVRQGDKLNIGQILAELAPLVTLKEDDSIIPRLRKLMRERDLFESP